MTDNAPINLAGEVVERIKSVEGFRYDTDVAVPLHVEKNRISTWKERGTVPYERLVQYTRTTGVSLDWLVNGRGPQRIQQGIQEDGRPYPVTPIIDSDLLVAVGKMVDSIFIEADVQADEEKRDRLMAIVYNDVVKETEHDVKPEKVRELAKLLG